MTRVLGIDPGTKRCGIAITDSARTMAFPRPALARDGELFDHLAGLIEEEGVDTVVIGRPLALSGNVTSSTDDADSVYHDLTQRFTNLLIVQVDERLTTVSAQKSLSEAGLKTKAHGDRIDSAAAVVILQNYVDGLNAG
ncbi:MAG TPA: Holliday junction resolvase RuvX [Acidimicrobiales bacterium]